MSAPQSVGTCPSSVVCINVGGTYFTSLRSTFLRLSGLFQSALDPASAAPRDELGYLFIDRDPIQFQLILKFVRDHQSAIGLSVMTNAARHELLVEAEYYLTDGLIETLIATHLKIFLIFKYTTDARTYIVEGSFIGRQGDAV